MKAFIFRHPFISLLFGEAAISGIVNIVRTVVYAITERGETNPGREKKEEEPNEPSVTVE